MNAADRRAAVAASAQFARHHLTSLALLVLGLGVLAFLAIADEVLEGDTLYFDRWLLLAILGSVIKTAG